MFLVIGPSQESLKNKHIDEERKQRAKEGRRWV